MSAGARAAFRHLPVERAFRDVRTFSLHFRESAVLRMLADADLGGEFHSKQKYGPKIGRQSWEGLRGSHGGASQAARQTRRDAVTSEEE